MVVQSELVIGRQAQQVHFPDEWPADALGFFPGLAEHLRRHPDAESWGAILILIEKAGMVAVGNMGTKGPPDSVGTVDIGYGMNLLYEGRGYMTEAVQGVAWLLARPEVMRVTADCLSINIGSVRVLEKAGFVRLHEHDDADAYSGRMRPVIPIECGGRWLFRSVRAPGSLTLLPS